MTSSIRRLSEIGLAYPSQNLPQTLYPRCFASAEKSRPIGCPLKPGYNAPGSATRPFKNWTSQPSSGFCTLYKLSRGEGRAILLAAILQATRLLMNYDRVMTLQHVGDRRIPLWYPPPNRPFYPRRRFHSILFCTFDIGRDLRSPRLREERRHPGGDHSRWSLNGSIFALRNERFFVVRLRGRLRAVFHCYAGGWGEERTMGDAVHDGERRCLNWRCKL